MKRPYNILVVDDEPDLQPLITQRMRRRIRRGTHSFEFAQDGIEALEKLNANPDIDMVITDINMPRMDGLTLLDQIPNVSDIDVRCIVVSAYGDMQNIRTAMNRGAFDFVTKPLDFEDLQITMERALHHLEEWRAALSSRDALVAKLTSLGPKYFVSVMSAQDGLRVVLDPVRGRAKLLERLQSLDVRGVPGLMDVVEQVSEIADQTLASAEVRVAVLFITDGEIEDYRGDYTIPVVNPSDSSDLSRRFRGQLILERIRSIVDRLEGAQAPLFFLHLARQYDSLNEVYQNGISEFSQTTGGRAVFVRGVQEVPAVVEQLLDEIAAHSVVSIDASCEGIQKLEIRSPVGSVRHRETVRCP